MHSLYSKYFLKYSLNFHRNDLTLLKTLFHIKPAIVLGIETSCDDTGCGIVDSTGTVLGEAISSQHNTHLNFGGIIPTVARLLHTSNITTVCEHAFRSANLKLQDISAVATTVKPGLPMSLNVGTKFGKYLANIGNKPFIPIHHMEAHALTVRMSQKVDFPYVVLLVSGGHCLLAIVEDVSKFYLLGTTEHKAPGEVFDKIARRLKLRNIPEFSTLNGGVAIETAARKASNVDQFKFKPLMLRHYDCNFNFSALLYECTKYIEEQEEKHSVVGDMIIPDFCNLCAAFQLAAITHICQRTQRALEFIEEMSLFPKDKRTLVASGGVACNNALAKSLDIISTKLGYNFVRTPPKLCTDNGIMIAWNGVERLNVDKGVIRNENDIDKVCIENNASLGEDWTKRVKAANLKCNWIDIEKELA